MYRLNDKVAIVVGVNSVGMEIAGGFVSAGAHVILAAPHHEDQVALELLGTAASFVRADMTVENDVTALLRFAGDRHGGLDCLVNVTVVPSSPERLEDLEVDEFSGALEANLSGALNGIKHASSYLRAGGGSIINVIGCRSGDGGLPYSVSRAALLDLTGRAAVGLRGRGIRVNSISAAARADAAVSAAAVYLASDAASAITGSDLPVGGDIPRA